MKTRIANVLAAVLVALAFAAPVGAQTPAPAAAPASGGSSAPVFSQEQLDSLVAPIALYPDQILVQIFMAATYPLDVVEAARFVKANRDKLKGDAMVKAAEEKNWDPSVQSLTAYGQVLEMMNDKLEWTQQLGDAVLADEKAVMATAQKLRQKASDAGNLKSNEQQKVTVQQDKTIIIEPAQPQTVYIPTYNPTVVYGSWWAPAYPPYYYPPPPYYYPGYAFGAAAIGFGVGLAVGAAWGWAGANWGGGDININRNNTFVRNSNNAEFKNRSGNSGRFEHSAANRKNVGYRDQGTRSKYGAGDRGGAASRNDYRGRDGGASAGGLDRGGAGGIDRGSGPSAGVADRAGAGNRAGAGAGAGGGGFDRGGGAGGGISAGSPANRTGGGGQNFGGGGSNFGGGSGSFNSGQSRAQASSYSNRGASSRASMGGGGGGARAGGGGGGGRGGGGGGRGGGRR